MHHFVITIEGSLGSCYRKERFATRFEAEQRAAELRGLDAPFILETRDDQGRLIPMPSNSTEQLLHLLYPKPSVAAFLRAVQ